MEIREATEADIPEIIALLKQSLGETLLPKSEQYWRWKHLENPFGVSPTLLCFEDGTLIGIRAFMQWQWKNKRQIYRALRAVDTATHPLHQGKGIFKKLTLSLLEICKAQGYDLIFNTPNEQSKPGYLKMGWIEAGKLPVRLSLQRPAKVFANVFRTPSDALTTPDSSIEYFLNHHGLDHLLNVCQGQHTHIVTNVTKDYLRWRYLTVPITRYVAVGQENGDELNALIVGRIKLTRWGRELRITDFFTCNSTNRKLLTRKYEEVKKEWKVDYTTFSGTIMKNLTPFSGFTIPIGPIVTLRSLALTELREFVNFDHWSPSLGDLELF
jgi:N-acetylglutamate synthase-like GNAT family acetyltransferase